MLSFALQLSRFDIVFESMSIRWEIVQFNTIRLFIQSPSVFMDMQFKLVENYSHESTTGLVTWSLVFEKNPTLDTAISATELLNPNLDMVNCSSIVKVGVIAIMACI